MRRWFLRGTLALCASVTLVSCTEKPISSLTNHPTIPARQADEQVAPPLIAISQVYGGGGNAGATLKNDFIELFNPGNTAVNVSGWSVQYASVAGTTWQVTNISGSIPAGGYYLVQEAVGAGGTQNLPTPDATGAIPMAATAGKVLLAKVTTAQTGACPTGANIVDEVSFNTGVSNACGTTTAALSNTQAALRNNFGCANTGSTIADFSITSLTGVPVPRNSASAPHPCGGVVDNTPASVTVTPVTASIELAGTQAFTAVTKNAANSVISVNPTWASRTPAVASVSATGVATGLAAGTSWIVATHTLTVRDSALLTVTAPPPVIVADLEISQIYGGGGNAGAQYSNDYIELFNRGEDAINLTGWSVQYVSAAGTSWAATPLSGSILPHKHFLVQEAQGAATPQALPTPDAFGTLAMGAGAGKVLLAQTTVPFTTACPVGANIMDKVGYGANTTDNGCTSTWGGRTGDLSNTTAAFRNNDGCVDTNNAANDFTVLIPYPRNSASPAKFCNGGPARPQSSATLAINELMGDPANAESASWGEWFEVYNYGATPIDLHNWTIMTAGSVQPDHVISSSVIVPAGGYAVLGRGGDFSRNGGVNLDYNYFVGNATTIWLDNADFLMLVDDQGARVDSVSWTSLPRGVTKGLRNAGSAHADVNGANWGFSTTQFGDGDYGTPDANNEPLANTPPFVSPNTITFSGRAATDAPVPVGFEAQVFATELRAPFDTVHTTFTWLSLTPTIATIDGNGVFHALLEGTATFKVTAEDGATRRLSLPTSTPVASTTAQYLNNTEFGEPTPGVGNNDFILRKAQYTTSFNGSRGIPNWVAYDLNATHIVAGQDRCNCFTFDPELEAAGFARYTTADYTGAGGFAGYGIDRGHMTRSFDRTAGTLDNALTFNFSNVVPQAANVNQGPWALMENALGDKATSQNKEVYIYVGPAGSKGTVKNQGKITIPAWVWKVAVIMPRGQGLADVHSAADIEVVAVVMKNDSMVNGVSQRNNQWEPYKVTVDSVEALTGYDLLSLLPDNIEIAVESGTHAPVAAVDGPYTANANNAVAVSAAASTDADAGQTLTYAWTFGDGGTATGATASHAYTHSGTFTVQVIVTDPLGIADTATTSAHIVDTTVPTIASDVGGTQVNGWYTTDVAISWLIDDPESGVASSTGCTTSSVTTDTNGVTYTCSVTNGDGLTNSQSITIKRDVTAPVVSPSVTGTAGTNGWYTSDVGVSWNVSDATSNVTKDGCTDGSVTTDNANATFHCSATDEAGNTTTQDLVVKRDASAPTAAPSVAGTLGANGWYTSDINVSWNIGDEQSGVFSSNACSPVTVSTNTASQSFTCSVVNGAGLSFEQSVTVKRDASAPTVTYTGNAAVYQISDNISITCAAADVGPSGMASTTCANVTGAAYTFGLGSHTYNATGTDNAGNIGNGSMTFTVGVSAASLSQLVNTFVTQAGIANALTTKLSHGQYAAFINQVQAQSGKALTVAQANLLIQLAGSL